MLNLRDPRLADRAEPEGTGYDELTTMIPWREQAPPSAPDAHAALITNEETPPISAIEIDPR